MTAKLTLVKEDSKSEITQLFFHFLKDRSEITEPTVQYGENFCFECNDKKYSGFFAALYALIKFFKFFDYLFNKDENKVASNEEFLFHLEAENFQMSNSQMKSLNDILTKKSFIISERHLSIVDIFYFSVLYKWMEKTSIKEKMEYLSVCRWFIYLQDVLLKKCDFMKRLEFQNTLQNCIKDKLIGEDEIEEKNKKEIKGKTTTAATTSIPKGEKGKKQKVKEKEKKGEQKNQSAKEKVEARALDDITRLNMLVGYVEHVEVHPDADTLYCLKINVGESNVRDICSGLRNKKNAEDLLNKYVIVLANLKEKMLRGKKSHGMVLCGSHDDKIELLQPPPGVQIGERIFCENSDVNLLPDKVLSFDKAKNPFFHIQPNLILKKGVAYFKEAKLLSSQGEIVCVLQEGSIS